MLKPKSFTASELRVPYGLLQTGKPPGLGTETSPRSIRIFFQGCLHQDSQVLRHFAVAKLAEFCHGLLFPTEALLSVLEFGFTFPMAATATGGPGQEHNVLSSKPCKGSFI